MSPGVIADVVVMPDHQLHFDFFAGRNVVQGPAPLSVSLAGGSSGGQPGIGYGTLAEFLVFATYQAYLHFGACDWLAGFVRDHAADDRAPWQDEFVFCWNQMAVGLHAGPPLGKQAHMPL